MNCTIELECFDGEYTFALTLPRIAELQTKTGIGIGGLFARVLQGCAFDAKGQTVLAPAHAQFYVADLIETIRQGLIGGGKGTVDGQEIPVSPALANRLIDSYVANRPLGEAWQLAVAILGATIHGYDPPKKAGPAGEPATETATAP